MEGRVNSFEDLYQQRKNWVDASRTNGFEDGILNLLTELYPDNAHFIYELLQNAEDVAATEVHFSLTDTCLLVRHNAKRQFTFEDVNSITSIGKSTKKDDVVQIGKFGVGFKAVFAYTSSPRVFSRNFSFEIRDLVIPRNIENTHKISCETVFEFPFDNPKKNSQSAYQEIKAGLDNLTVKTLLFLENIKKITWTIEAKVAVIEKVHEEEDYISLRKVDRENLISSTHWLKFSKPLANQKALSVSIAYKLDLKNKNQNFDRNKILGDQFKVIIDTLSSVSVYFPAEKEISNLKFNVNAPFSSTVARDSVQNRSENEELIDDLANLAAESLYKIKHHGLLTTEFFEVLPNREDNIPIFYSPILERILEEFETNDLVPCQNKKYLASNCVYESSAKFRSTFDVFDLRYFVGRELESVDWLSPYKNKRQKQFISDLNIVSWGVEELLEFLDVSSHHPEYLHFEPSRKKFNEWLKSKGKEWIKSFYLLLLEECSNASWDENYIGKLSSFRILITNNNELASPDECYFPTKVDNENIKIINLELLSNFSKEVDDNLRKFFDSIGVRTYGERDEIELILEKYYKADGRLELSIEEHLTHFKKFVNYYLNGIKSNDRSLFSSKSFIVVDGNCTFPAAKTYLSSEYISDPLEIYFDFLSNAEFYPISDIYLDCGIELAYLVEFFKWVGCVSTIQIKETNINNNPDYKRLISSYGKWTNYSVRKDFTIDGLDELLKSESLEVSKLLFKTLNQSYKSQKHAKALYRRNKSEPYNFADSYLIYKLKSSNWLPTEDGRFLTPASISRSLIHTDFRNFENTELSRDICLFSEEDKQRSVSDEKQQKAKDLGFDSAEKANRLLELSRLYTEEDIRNLIEAKTKVEAKYDLPDYTPRNAQFRSQRVLDELNTAQAKVTEIRERSVAIGKTDIVENAKEYLKAQYTNGDGIQICQICKDELPFKKFNDGEYYFEAAEYFKSSTKHLYQNYLCLCPNHSAMFKHANNSRDSLVQLLLEANENRVAIELANMNLEIYFTSTHILDLKTLLANKSEDRLIEDSVEIKNDLSSTFEPTVDTADRLDASESITQEKQATTKIHSIEDRKLIIESFNKNFLERVKAMPMWNKAYLYCDEFGVWCLSSKNCVVVKCLSEKQAIAWWDVYVSNYKPKNPKLKRV